VVAAKPSNADAWNYLGFSNRKLKKFDLALSAYQKALAIDPNHRGANEYLGELYLQTDNLEKARERLKKLDDICYFGCDEFDDLKAAIIAYENQ
jgi:tetratricopeptide (TPR) repeat protein